MTSVYGVSDLARALGISPALFRARWRRGKLEGLPEPAGKIDGHRGGVWVWTGDEVDAWLAGAAPRPSNEEPKSEVVTKPPPAHPVEKVRYVAPPPREQCGLCGSWTVQQGDKLVIPHQPGCPNRPKEERP